MGKLASTSSERPVVKRDRSKDLLLLAAMLRGEPNASATFVDRFNDVIELSVRTVYRRAGMSPTEDEIRDVISEVWLSLLDNDKRSLRRFEPDREIQVGTWIAVLARNKTIDRLRTRRDRYVFVAGPGQLEENAGTVPPPSVEMEVRERGAIATEAFNQLREDDKRFLEAWYLEDRRPNELADEFGIAVGTVYSRRFKIQQKLAQLVHRMYRPLPRTLH